MMKVSYEKPSVQVLAFDAEDAIRTSSNSVTGSGDAIFKGYSSEDWN